MGGGSPTQPTQTTTQVLSPEQQQLMSLAMPGAKQFAAQVPQRYQGSQITPFNANETAGQQGVISSLPDIAQTGQNAAKSNNFYTGGDIWNPASNPNLQGAIDASVRPIYQNLTEKALPAIRQDAVSTGNFGGSRQGIAEGQAVRDASVAAGDTASKLAQSQYDTNINAQLKAEALAPSVQQGLTAAGTVQSGVGDVQRALTQAQLGEKVGQFNWDQYAPFLQSKDIMSLLQGLPGGSTVATGNTPTSAMPGMTSALSGAASGAALGSALFPGVGTAVGAGAGALLPFLFK